MVIFVKYVVIKVRYFFIEKWGKDVYAPFAMRLHTPPVSCHAWVWLRGCVGARLRCAIISFDKRVYICCLAASCLKMSIVRHDVTGVTGDSRPYVFYII